MYMYLNFEIKGNCPKTIIGNSFDYVLITAESAILSIL